MQKSIQILSTKIFNPFDLGSKCNGLLTDSMIVFGVEVVCVSERKVKLKYNRMEMFKFVVDVDINTICDDLNVWLCLCY